MRKLVWFAIGFGAACAATAYGIVAPSLLLTVVCAGFLLPVFSLLRNKPRFFAAVVLLAGVTFGLLWFWVYENVYLQVPAEVHNVTCEIQAEAVDYSYETEYGSVVDCDLSLEGKTYRARVYLNRKEIVAPGSVISGRFRLVFTAAADRKSDYHMSLGIFLLAYPDKSVTVTEPAAESWKYLPVSLQNQLKTTIECIFPDELCGFAKALLLGDTSGLTYTMDSDFKLSGIRHVVAVSGLHVSILFSVIYLFTGKRRIATVAAGIPLLALFAAMAGFTPSVTRACLMQLLMLAALLFRKEYDPPTALAFSVIIMLLVNPMTITSVGFQLSVGSVSGIFLFSERIKKRILSVPWMNPGSGKSLRKRVIYWFTGSVSVSISATVMTVPLTAWYFGCVSLVGVLTNLLTLWVVTFVFCGIIFACMVSWICLPAGHIIAWVVSWPIRYILSVSRLLSSAPLAAVYTESVYITVWLVFVYILLALYLLIKKRQPLVLGGCALIGLCVALLASWVEPLMDHYRVTLLDVGQGQCVLLQSGGKTFAVDCGGSRDDKAADLAAATLLSQGVSRIDGLILSHSDGDHVGGAAGLLHRIKTDLLVLPNGEDPENLLTDIEMLTDGSVLRPDRNFEISWDTASICVFPSNQRESSNESSLCVLFQTESCDILITGDRSVAGELELLSSGLLPDLEILVVGHHGAQSSTGQQILSVTKPELALISVGKDNPYGHPAQVVLDRLAQNGCKIRRTDIEGTIIIRG